MNRKSFITAVGALIASPFALEADEKKHSNTSTLTITFKPEQIERIKQHIDQKAKEIGASRESLTIDEAANRIAESIRGSASALKKMACRR